MTSFDVDTVNISIAFAKYVTNLTLKIILGCPKFADIPFWNTVRFFFIQLIYTMTIIIQKVTKLTYNRYGNQIRETKKVKKKYKYICIRK